MTHQELAEQIFDMSAKALAEKDREGFLKWLFRRSPLVAQLAGKSIHADIEVLKRWLDMESRILARLKEEQAELLKKVDEISRGKKAVRQYSLGCIVPPGPLYCNKKG